MNCQKSYDFGRNCRTNLEMKRIEFCQQKRFNIFALFGSSDLRSLWVLSLIRYMSFHIHVEIKLVLHYIGMSKHIKLVNLEKYCKNIIFVTTYFSYHYLHNINIRKSHHHFCQKWSQTYKFCMYILQKEWVNILYERKSQ